MNRYLSVGYCLSVSFTLQRKPAFSLENVGMDIPDDAA
jgi:hypothetical protein